MRLVEKLSKKMVGNIYTMEEIDSIMEEKKYIPIESDDESEEGVLKYSNKSSQMWLKYVREEEDYLVSDVTLRTKKAGKTKVRAFRTVGEIKSMMDYFRDNDKDEEFLIFMLGIFLGRRIGDTLSLKWSDLYYENGKKKDKLKTLVEEKTGKTVEISLTDITWKYIDWYCDKKKIVPMEQFKQDIFPTEGKTKAILACDGELYSKAIDKQAASYRYEFKKAANACDIEDVSTHSTRKTFGYISHEINKFDPDCLPVLQTIYGHKDIETTKIYIDIMDEKAEKYFGDVGKYIEDIDNGITPVIDNIPVIALKTNDMRSILQQAFILGRKFNGDEEEAIQTVNKLISKVEEMRIS